MVVAPAGAREASEEHDASPNAAKLVTRSCLKLFERRARRGTRAAARDFGRRERSGAKRRGPLGFGLGAKFSGCRVAERCLVPWRSQLWLMERLTEAERRRRVYEDPDTINLAVRAFPASDIAQTG